MKNNSKLNFNLDELKMSADKFLSNKKRVGKAALIVLILVFAVVLRINNSEQTDVQVEVTNTAEPVAEELYVDISGEIKNPGVYVVEEDTRLYEVINKAGGLTENADTNQINQAGYVEDGEKIIIPSLNIGTDGSSDTEISVTSSVSGTNNVSSNGLININTASKDQLMEISGVGEVIAERIMEYRTSNRFQSVEDIMNVKGIGNATYEKMRSQITT